MISQNSKRQLTGMIFEMTEVKVSMNKMSDAFSKIVDESQRRDQRFEELWIRINEDIRTREQRTEARIAGIEKHIDAKIEEKFTDLEARMGAVEKNQEQTKRLAVKKVRKKIHEPYQSNTKR